MQLGQLPTPALCVEASLLDANIDAMAAVRPGGAVRPHVKAHKSTELARHVAVRGAHPAFCAATLREVEGMVAAGVGDDLLLANETLDAGRLGVLAASAPGRITVAVDGPETVAAAVEAGRRAPLAVLVDVDVGLPRCGCRPEDAGALADAARSGGLEVRGVMGYEGHVVANPDRTWRAEQVASSMDRLRAAHDDVGGDVVSAGGTGTFDLHDPTTEVQAGSYLLMDTHYGRLGLPFAQALRVLATVISVNDGGHAVADAGLKAFGMDHGDPEVVGRQLFFCSDEHTTFLWEGDHPRVGDRVWMLPSHVDPTVAYHPQLWIIDGEEVLDRWPVDLRHW